MCYYSSLRYIAPIDSRVHKANTTAGRGLVCGCRMAFALETEELPRPGTLATASEELLGTLRGDLGHLSANFGLRVELAKDGFKIQGCEGPEHAQAVQKELQAPCIQAKQSTNDNTCYIIMLYYDNIYITRNLV